MCGGDGAAPRVSTVRWSADWYAPSSAGWCGDPPRLPADGWQRHAGTYLHTAHHSSIVRICYHHHPFCGQTVEIIRWLRRQTSDSLVIKLQDGLELAIPSWMLDPLACSHVSDAPAPRLSVEALLALRDLLDHQPLLHAAIPATPCVSQPEGARDAQESSSSPTAARAPCPAPTNLVWHQLPTDKRQQCHELMAQLLIHVSHSAPSEECKHEHQD